MRQLGKLVAVLQAYQTDLLKDLDQGEGLSPKAVSELCIATDLALRATKHLTPVSLGTVWHCHWGGDGQV